MTVSIFLANRTAMTAGLVGLLAASPVSIVAAADLSPPSAVRLAQAAAPIPNGAIAPPPAMSSPGPAVSTPTPTGPVTSGSPPVPSGPSSTVPATPPAPPMPAARASVPASDMQVERRVADLRRRLMITSAQQPQFDAFSQAMRENARQMDQLLSQRRQSSGMNAVQSLQSYEELTAAHAQALQRLVQPFQALYAALSEQQKRTADTLFGEAARREQSNVARKSG